MTSVTISPVKVVTSYCMERRDDVRSDSSAPRLDQVTEVDWQQQGDEAASSCGSLLLPRVISRKVAISVLGPQLSTTRLLSRASGWSLPY